MSARINGYGDAPQSNVEYIATIHDTDWAGALTFFEIAHGGIKIKWASGETDNRHAPILGSSCDITMLVDTFNQTVLEVFLEDLRTSTEGRFWLEITSNGDYATVWRGVVIADNSYEKDQATPYEVTISAVDGIALLKKEPYLNSGALYTGTNTAVRHITRCLQKLPHIAFWGSSDNFLETSLDWWADSMSAGGSSDPLLLSYIDNAAFYDYYTTGSIDKDVISCYDVLANIMTTFGARIKLLGDMFRVEQIDYRANHIYEYRRYDQTGAFKSNSTHSGINNINQTATGAKVSYVTYDYIPQIWKAQVTYEAKLRRNFWGNILLAESVTYNFNQEISSNSGAATFRIRGIFWVNIKNKVTGGYTGSMSDVLFAEMGLTLKVGSNYLKRTGTYSNFSWHPAPAEWTASAADKVAIVSDGHQVPPAGISSSFILPFDFITPALPSDGSANAESATFIRLMRNNNESVTASQFDITWTAGSMWMEVFDLGTPDVQEDEILYESVNPDEGSEIWEATTRLGGGSANYAGRLMNSSNVPWAQWGAGVSARDQAIGGLLADTVLNGQLRAIKRVNGEFYGVIDPLKLIHTSDGIDWLMMQAVWSLTEDRINGSWFEVDYGSAGVASTPIKVKIIHTSKFPETSFPNPPISTGNGNQGFASNSPGTVLAPIAWNTLSSPILEGATVTSIPLTAASSGADFLAGDVVTLAHPITGKYQNFTVSSAPSAGATSLAVTSATAEFDAPTGTFLVVKQKAYSFSLPTGTAVGQIIQWNGSAWVEYSVQTKHDTFNQATNFTAGSVTLTLTESPIFGVSGVDYNGRILRSGTEWSYSTGIVTILFADPYVTSFDEVPYFQVTYNY